MQKHARLNVNVISACIIKTSRFGTRMPTRFRVLAISIVLMSTALVISTVYAQDTLEQREQQEEQVIQGKNPLMPRKTQVAFSGNGSANFTPRSAASMPGATADPNCTPAVTPVGFNIQCLSDPDSKSSTTCRGSLSFYGFNESRSVVGDVTPLPGDVYAMKLKSATDDDIQGCELVNVAPISASMGNVITMPGCGINIAGCAGEATGSGADHAVTSSASVILTPSD
jgi:hypothetical protein